MTAPVITGGSITGVALSGNTLTNPVITGGSINNTPIGATTANTGKFTTLEATGATTFSGAVVMSASVTANTFSSSGATITGGSVNGTTVGASTRSTGAFTTLASNGATTFTAGTASTSTTTGTAVITGGLGVSGRINAANFDGIVGANTAAAGNFTTLGATGVATFSAGTVSAPAITTTGDTNTGIFFPAADTIAFAEGGVESMRIDSAGNLGIGTSSPSSFSSLARNLVVQGGATTGITISESTGAGTASLLFAATSSFANKGSIACELSSASLTFGTNATEKMRIDLNGNVGIGVTNPSNFDATGQRLVVGSGTGAQGMSIYSGTTSTGNLLFAKGTTGDDPYRGLIRYDHSSNFMSYWTAATERMRIDSAGNVGIGTSSPTNKLTVAGATGLKVYYTGGTDGNSAGSIALGDGVRSDNYVGIYRGTSISGGSTSVALTLGAYEYIGFNVSTTTLGSQTERMRIDSGGNLLVGTTSSIASAKLTVNGQIATSGFIGINASTATTIATGVSFLAVLRDRGNGGTAMVLYDNNSSPAVVIVSQTGSTKFVTAAPSATEIQIANGGNAITALAGASIGATNINVSVIANQ
jgi:hypothetical protein